MRVPSSVLGMAAMAISACAPPENGDGCTNDQKAYVGDSMKWLEYHPSALNAELGRWDLHELTADEVNDVLENEVTWRCVEQKDNPHDRYAIVDPKPHRVNFVHGSSFDDDVEEFLRTNWTQEGARKPSHPRWVGDFNDNLEYTAAAVDPLVSAVGYAIYGTEKEGLFKEVAPVEVKILEEAVEASILNARVAVPAGS